MPKRVVFNADGNFFIGDQHLRQGKPCQDYTLTERINDAMLAVVCDGCSTGLKTDVGARMWALATFAAIRAVTQKKSGVTFDTSMTREVDELRRAIVNESKKIYGLHSHDLLATCAYGLFSPNGGVVHLVGDGVIVEKHRDGRTVMVRYDWNNNTPAYPMYAEDFYVSFISAHGGNINAPALTCTTQTLVAGERKGTTVEEIALGAGMIGVTRSYTQEAVEALECVCFSTDGITQIRSSGNTDMADWVWAASELIRFKNSTGEFMKRRMKGLLQGIGKAGQVACDDLGCAAISMALEEDQKE